MREHLKKAASRVLGRIGYRAMRLADIADEADVNVSLFYHYFSSKADITREILTELLESGIKRASETRAPTPQDPFDAILNANLVTVDTYASTPGLMRCLLHFDEEATEFSELYRKVSLDWNRRVARDLARRIPDASLSDKQRLMIAYALGGMVDNFLFDLYVDRNPVLAESFKEIHEVAVFLSILWYRSIYLINPPASRLQGFSGFLSLTLQGK